MVRKLYGDREVEIVLRESLDEYGDTNMVSSHRMSRWR